MRLEQELLPLGGRIKLSLPKEMMPDHMHYTLMKACFLSKLDKISEKLMGIGVPDSLVINGCCSTMEARYLFVGSGSHIL